jgi:hypothetical protein
MRCHIDSSIQTFIDNKEKQTRVKMRYEAMRQRISLSGTTVQPQTLPCPRSF